MSAPLPSLHQVMTAAQLSAEVQNCKASLDNQAAFVQGIYQEMMEFCNSILENQKPDIGSLEFTLELTKTAESLAVSNGNEIKL